MQRSHQNTQTSQSTTKTTPIDTPPAFDWSGIHLQDPDTQGINSLHAIISDWKTRLKILRTYSQLEKVPTESEIKFYIENLLKLQREDTSGDLTGSWSLIEDYFDSDASTSFIYIPSIVIVSTLVLIRTKYPNVASGLPDLDDHLHRGLDFISRMNLSFNGYSGTGDLLSAVNYMAFGGTFTFAIENPDFCPEFNRTMNDAKNRII